MAAPTGAPRSGSERTSKGRVQTGAHGSFNNFLHCSKSAPATRNRKRIVDDASLQAGSAWGAWALRLVTIDSGRRRVHGALAEISSLVGSGCLGSAPRFASDRHRCAADGGALLHRRNAPVMARSA